MKKILLGVLSMFLIFTSGCTSKQDKNKELFQFEIEDVFSIKGRGSVVTGVVEGAPIEVNTRVSIVDDEGKEVTSGTITGIELFRKITDKALVGDEAGLLISDVDASAIKQGYIVKRK